jgi:hypothetical protein
VRNELRLPLALAAVIGLVLLASRGLDGGTEPHAPTGGRREAAQSRSVTHDASLESAPPSHGLRDAARGPASKLESAEALDPPDLHHLLSAARDAFLAERLRDMEQLVSRALSDYEAFERYIDGLSDPQRPQVEREVILWALDLLMLLADAARFDGSSEDQLALHGQLHLIFQRVLTQLGSYQREDSLALLTSFETRGVLGPEYLDVLQGWLSFFDYCAPLARMVMVLALEETPPRHDLLMDLVHHGGSEVGSSVAEALSETDPALSLELALELAHGLPRESPLRRRAGLLIAVHADPDVAFDFLGAEAASSYWVDLVPFAVTLDGRGLHEQAFERYLSEEDAELRRLLMLAGRQDVAFLEHVLDADGDVHIRSDALLNLAHGRTDEVTGERLVTALATILHPPTHPRAASYSPATVLAAVASFARTSPPDLRQKPIFDKLRDLVGEIADRPDLGPDLRARALETARTLGPP